MNTQELIAEAASLPIEKRALVVDSLLQSLNHPESDIDKAWLDIAQKRLLELKKGQVQPTNGSDAFERIWKKFEA